MRSSQPRYQPLTQRKVQATLGYIEKNSTSNIKQQKTSECSPRPAFVGQALLLNLKLWAEER